MFSFGLPNVSLLLLATMVLAGSTLPPPAGARAMPDTRPTLAGGESDAARDGGEYMQCGDARCEIAREYCVREHFAPPIPTRYSCRKLPRPECGNHAVGGNCLGDAKTGFILEIIYP
jgi:hypothetical protein